MITLTEVRFNFTPDHTEEYPVCVKVPLLKRMNQCDCFLEVWLNNVGSVYNTFEDLQKAFHEAQSGTDLLSNMFLRISQAHGVSVEEVWDGIYEAIIYLELEDRIDE